MAARAARWPAAATAALPLELAGDALLSRRDVRAALGAQLAATAQLPAARVEGAPPLKLLRSSGDERWGAMGRSRIDEAARATQLVAEASPGRCVEVWEGMLGAGLSEEKTDDSL